MQEYDARSRLESLPPEVMCEIFKLLLLGDSRSVESLFVSTKQLHAVWTSNEQHICRDRFKDYFRMATKVAFLQEESQIEPDCVPVVQHYGTTTVIIAPFSLLPACIADQFLDHYHAFSSYAVCTSRQTRIASGLPVRERRSNDKEVQIIFENLWRCKSPGVYTGRSWALQYEKALERGVKDGELTLRSLRMWNTLLTTTRLEGISEGAEILGY
ncbi:MAG: hypothetical protein Q9208_001357 [Pyrenodesmia sp. 3 TL-2023]